MAAGYASRGMFRDAYRGVDRGFWPPVGQASGDASMPVNLLFIHVTQCFRGALRSVLPSTSGT